MAKYNYIKVADFKNVATVKLADMKTFSDLVAKMKPDNIFTRQAEVASESADGNGQAGDYFSKAKSAFNKTVNAGGRSEFAFISDGTLYSVDGKGFTSLEDYASADKSGFASGSDFYASQKGGFKDAEEYKSTKQAGFSDKETFEKANGVGFIGAAAALATAHSEGKITDKVYNKVKNLKNDGELYKYARNNGYTNYQEFLESVSSGFIGGNATEYREAQEKGFANSDDYYKAKKSNFEDPKEFEAAKELGIEDKEEFAAHNSIAELKEKYSYVGSDQAHLHTILSKLEKGTKLSLKMIEDRLKVEQDKVKTKLPSIVDAPGDFFNAPLARLFKTNALPEWYNRVFLEEDSVKNFISVSDNIKALGTFDSDIEVFERK